VQQEDEVLDTWFSSALWPHSTLGWPERTPELARYYPTSVLITSRDIITLWVARMVLTGLNNMGEVPFRDVFIHPKILDSYGETMSKSKGNGVDPLDVIDKFGPDALRFGLAYLTTETQDVRMPVQFECPHCDQLIEQTRENREQARVTCTKCGSDFATQWARTEEDCALPRGLVVSERFEQARNFCNKLWNASRFALLNLQGFTPGAVADGELAIEDRWLLSRLAAVTAQVTDALEGYHYAEAARAIYDFAWDEFCSLYLEMVKGRMQDAASRPIAQRVLAHALDTLLRLLHPLIPFITEEVWQLLNRAAPVRGLAGATAAAESIMIAPWPVAESGARDELLESEFATFQAMLSAVREIRSRQNIPPKKAVKFYVRADRSICRLLEPVQSYFGSLANAQLVATGPDVKPPGTRAAVRVANAEVIVDLTGLIDVAAEIRRNEQQEKKLLGLIQGKKKKLSNAGFLERAPQDVVQRERESLAQLEAQLSSVRAALEELRRAG
jgi:valyl-tRNA synthetase